MGMDVGAKRGGTIASINVTPMADVMIVLLIIFMVTTPVIVQDKLKLPSAANARETKEDKDALVLSLSEHGVLSIDDRDVGPYESALGQVTELTTNDPERPVRIKADRTVPYAWISRLMSACRGATVQGIGLQTAKPEVRS
jgi:biopolymer transport protein TolR